jgi:hypothetical protein
MFRIKGRFSVPWSSPDAFESLYPGAFLFGEDRETERQSLPFLGTNGRRHSSIVRWATHTRKRHKSMDVVPMSPPKSGGRGFVFSLRASRAIRLSLCASIFPLLSWIMPNRRSCGLLSGFVRCWGRTGNWRPD